MGDIPHVTANAERHALLAKSALDLLSTKFLDFTLLSFLLKKLPCSNQNCREVFSNTAYSVVREFSMPFPGYLQSIILWNDQLDGLSQKKF